MPATRTTTPGTKKLIDQSALRIAENAVNRSQKKGSLRLRLRQFFSF